MMDPTALLARINALAQITDETDIDHPAYAALVEMLNEYREQAKPLICERSLDLRSDHGRHNRCPECREWVDTWDRQYYSAGMEWLWGSVMSAHLPLPDERPLVPGNPDYVALIPTTENGMTTDHELERLRAGIDPHTGRVGGRR